MWIQQIEDAPQNLLAAIDGLSAVQLDTAYRPEGWTLRQVVHHLADSHINSYVRFKLALTEENPTIKPYDETAWAALPEARDSNVDVSVALLASLHQRWVRMLRTLGATEFDRTFEHPEMGAVRLDQNCAIYAWHSRHHIAHITELRRREGW